MIPNLSTLGYLIVKLNGKGESLFKTFVSANFSYFEFLLANSLNQKFYTDVKFINTNFSVNYQLIIYTHREQNCQNHNLFSIEKCWKKCACSVDPNDVRVPQAYNILMLTIIWIFLENHNRVSSIRFDGMYYF